MSEGAANKMCNSLMSEFESASTGSERNASSSDPAVDEREDNDAIDVSAVNKEFEKLVDMMSLKASKLWAEQVEMENEGSNSPGHTSSLLATSLRKILAIQDGTQLPANLIEQVLSLRAGDDKRTGNNDLYKTNLCRYYSQGVCPYGKRCSFAHGEEELWSHLVSLPNYKTKLCRQYHEQGFCEYGPRCHFIHTFLDEGITRKFEKSRDKARVSGESFTLTEFIRETLCSMSMRVCFFYRDNGNCPYGGKCRFVHLRSLNALRTEEALMGKTFRDYSKTMSESGIDTALSMKLQKQPHGSEHLHRMLENVPSLSPEYVNQEVIAASNTSESATSISSWKERGPMAESPREHRSTHKTAVSLGHRSSDSVRSGKGKVLESANNEEMLRCMLQKMGVALPPSTPPDTGSSGMLSALVQYQKLQQQQQQEREQEQSEQLQTKQLLSMLLNTKEARDMMAHLPMYQQMPVHGFQQAPHDNTAAWNMMLQAAMMENMPQQVNLFQGDNAGAMWSQVAHAQMMSAAHADSGSRAENLEVHQLFDRSFDSSSSTSPGTNHSLFGKPFISPPRENDAYY